MDKNRVNIAIRIKYTSTSPADSWIIKSPICHRSRKTYEDETQHL